MAETAKRVDPFPAFRFHVEIGGVTYGWFRECTGLSSEIAVQDNPRGGESTAGKLPGRPKYVNIVLKWGMTDAPEAKALYQWHLAAVKGKVERKSGSIVLLDSNYKQEKARWNFKEGWPAKWEGPHFNATSDEVAIQTIEIAHEGVEQV